MNPTDRDYALADLEEDYERQLTRAGPGAARRWYRGQVVRSLWPCVRSRLSHITAPGLVGRTKPIGRHRVIAFDFVRDFRLALRGIRSRPGFAAIVVLTLTLGIGATTAVFSVVNGVLLNPLHHPDADQLVILWETDQHTNPPGTRNNVSPANFADWRELNRVFEDIAAYSIGQATLTGLGNPEMVTRGWITSGFLWLLRARPAFGRGFLPGEGSNGADNVVVLSYDFWNRRYASDPDVIGSTLTLNGDSYTIVGVLERGVDFLARGIQIWTPYRMGPSDFANRGTRSLNVLARMKPGVTLQQTRTEMAAIADRIRLEDPEWMTGRGVNVVPLRDELVGRVEPALLVLFGAVLVVLLIATVNVANLFLVRATERRRDLAVQQALGAGRGRLIRRSLAECLTLSVGGGTIGLLLAAVGTDALLAFAPSNLPRIDAVAIDARVLVFGLVVSLVTGCACGVLPALQNPGGQLNDALKEGARTATKGGRGQLRRGLVVAQVALSMILLIVAGLLTRTFWQLNAINPGFSPERVLTVKVRLPAREYPDVASMTTFYDELLRAVRALPQVNSAALTRFLPLSDGPWTYTFEVEGQPTPVLGQKQSRAYHPVSTDYFRTAGITLLQGRDFTTADNADAVPVLVINGAMKRVYWPNQDPIGQRIRFDFDASGGPWREIVGVVADVHHDALHWDPRPTVYGPESQAFAAIANRLRLLVRTSGEPLQLAQSVRRIVQRIDPDLPVFDIRTMDQIVAGSVSQQRFSMLLIGGFAAAAALLALLGVYGVVSYAVRDRTQELGLRVALGAGTGRTVRFVLREGLTPTLAGIAVGVTGALLTSRLLDSLLFGVSSTDPLTYAMLAPALAVAAGVACSVPAYKAATVDPIAVLRLE
jgi:predicted permease